MRTRLQKKIASELDEAYRKPLNDSSDTLDYAIIKQIAWIDVKKAKPTEDGYYLVWRATKDTFERAYHSRRFHAWSGSFGDFQDVTYWARVPAPKGE